MITRQRVWRIVELAKPGDKASRYFDISLLSLILLNVIAMILGSVKSIEHRWASLLNGFELVSVLIFSFEYVARLWSCTADSQYRDPIRGPMRLAVRPMLVIDLLAILPFYLTFLGIDLRSLRILRLMRVAKMGRYYASLRIIEEVFRSKREQLILTASIMSMLLIVSSSLLYFCENGVQPDAFSSIPATMWWAVATLTTVGYGDMYPVTLLGKLFASVVAVLGIGMFALPTGILGAGFLEAVQRRKVKDVCPHCGKSPDDDRNLDTNENE